jgi:hypothetical protein
MHLADTHGLCGNQLLSSNRCQCYGNLLFLSDLTNAAGTGINQRFVLPRFAPLECPSLSLQRSQLCRTGRCGVHFGANSQQLFTNLHSVHGYSHLTSHEIVSSPLKLTLFICTLDLAIQGGINARVECSLSNTFWLGTPQLYLLAFLPQLRAL